MLPYAGRCMVGEVCEWKEIVYLSAWPEMNEHEHVEARWGLRRELGKQTESVISDCRCS